MSNVLVIATANVVGQTDGTSLIRTTSFILDILYFTENKCFQEGGVVM